MLHRIAITPGEPAGIGPDLCIELTQRPPEDTELVFVADPALLKQRAAQLGLPITLKQFDPTKGEASKPGQASVLAVELAKPVVCGKLDAANSPYVLETLSTASDRVLSKELDALVTGPVHKGIINDAGIGFSGHTEFLADYCASNRTVMMLATEGLRVALVTTHLPLNKVAGAITKELLNEIIVILHRDLQGKFGISNPKILVCGLNPHAGEGGHMGREEIDIIEPVLEENRSKGMDLIGPLPADTLFTGKYLQSADAVLSMYHDQGLPVLKFKGFGNASNITLGLPIIRTSVDHGTALDLAGSGSGNRQFVQCYSYCERNDSTLEAYLVAGSKHKSIRLNTGVSHRARKRFGQNFLHDQSIIDRIIKSINPTAEDHLLEIGPGQGALTSQLAAVGARLDCIELDRDLVAHLSNEYQQQEQVCIHQQDILKVDLQQIAELGGNKKLRIIGNLPYNISTPVLFHLLKNHSMIKDMVFMLQLEVVQRMSAGVGDKNYGRLGLMLQYYCTVEHLFNVPATAFTPQPKVNSAIVRLTPHAKPPIRAKDVECLQTVIRTAFNQRRKTLRNSMKTLISAEQLDSLALDASLRPENLSLADFILIADSLSSQS